MVRAWWRMDRALARGELPSPVPVGGYLLLDGAGVAKGSWEHIHNRSFADHWRFSPRTEEELIAGKPPELCLMAVTAFTGEPAAGALWPPETYGVDSPAPPGRPVSAVGAAP